MILSTYLARNPLFSSLSMNNGIRTIPGAAIAILLKVTMAMPCLAATLDSPNLSPSAVKTATPKIRKKFKIGLLVDYKNLMPT